MKQFVFGKNLSSQDFINKQTRDSDLRFDSAVKYDLSKAYGGATSTDAYGGYTIPTPLADYFIDMVEKDVFARQIFEVRAMDSSTLEIPTRTAGMSVFHLSGEGVSLTTEAGATGATTALSRSTFGTMTLTAQKFVVWGGYTTDLAEDSLINIGDMLLQTMARDLAEAEEKAIIQGEASGTSTSFAVGDPRYAFDGLIWHVYGSNASTGAVWTPDNASPVMWADGGSDVLTADELNAMSTRISEQGFKCTHIMVRPTIAGRLRDPTEFEMFQGIKDIGGDMAALVKGFVGRYYESDILVSSLLPLGTSDGYSGTGGEFVTGTDDSTIIAFDVREPIIADRRKLEVRTRHNYDSDVEEARYLTRMTFDVKRPLALAGINDVKNAVS